MKFLSYNLRNARFREELNTDAWNNWRYRRDAALTLVHDAGADVIALQEDSEEQANDMREALRSTHRAFCDPAFYAADSANNALFVRNSIAVSTSGSLWISSDGQTQTKPDGSICMRHLTYLRLKLPSGPLLVVDVHLDHNEDPAFKQREAALFAGHLGTLSGKPPRRTIVLGDFNTVPDLPAYHAMEAFGLRDAARLKGSTQPTALHWGARPAHERIDYVWLSEDLAAMLTDYQVLDGAYRRHDGSAGHASDNSAVLASLDL